MNKKAETQVRKLATETAELECSTFIAAREATVKELVKVGIKEIVIEILNNPKETEYASGDSYPSTRAGYSFRGLMASMIIEEITQSVEKQVAEILGKESLLDSIIERIQKKQLK
jgi:hypothetical protein